LPNTIRKDKINFFAGRKFGATIALPPEKHRGTIFEADPWNGLVLYVISFSIGFPAAFAAVLIIMT
jgi:hypothetical protein